MPGRSDFSGGFTKQAQKAKFMRHRDIKLKDKELRKENHISKAMCEGICDKCREKVQWRFKYDKYRPLKNPGNCQQCRQKVITKAYRTICDKCAAARKVCPSCCVDLEELKRMRAQLEESTKSKMSTVDGDNESDEPMDEAEEVSENDEEMEQAENQEQEDIGMNTCSESTRGNSNKVEDMDAENIPKFGGPRTHDDEGDDDDDDEDDEEDSGEDQSADEEDANDTNEDIDQSNSVIQEMEQRNSVINLSEVVWNQKKFENMAANKYSKNRVVGQN